MSKDIQEAIKRLKLCSNNECNICGRYEKEECMLERNRCEKTVLNYIETLEKENTRLKLKLKVTAYGLDKEKQDCFYEDGHTNKCLGYSFFNNDEPCIYCKTCERLSTKEED